MKRIVSLWLILLTVLTATACQRQTVDCPPSTDEAASATSSTTVSALQTSTTTSVETVNVYEQAEKDFLTPLEEYSWERQYAPELVMIHFTSAVVNHREDPYRMDYVRDTFIEYNVSVHYVVQRDGTVYCYIPEDRVAWHAGVGEFNGDPRYTDRMNQYAIGIEVVGIGSETDMAIYMTSAEYRALDDSLKGFTDAQYQALALLVEDLCTRYRIPRDADHVIGHEMYNPKKNDPGELFDWDRLWS